MSSGRFGGYFEGWEGVEHFPKWDPAPWFLCPNCGQWEEGLYKILDRTACGPCLTTALMAMAEALRHTGGEGAQ